MNNLLAFGHGHVHALMETEIVQPKSTFTKEDFKLAVDIGKTVLESKFGHLKDNLVQNIREALNPDLRLAGRVRARYDALLEAGFTHEEAVEYTSRSVNRTVDATLNSLLQTQEKETK